MEIRVEDYLSPKEMKEIVREEFAGRVYKTFSSEPEINRIIGNLSFQFVWKCVDQVLEGQLENLIREKTLEIINDLTSFSVFRRKDAWEKEDSVGQQILDKTVKDNMDIIQNKVKNYLQNYDNEQVLDEAISEAIIKKIMS